MWPIPELAATVSEITDPTKASVIAIFKDPKNMVMIWVYRLWS